MDSIYFIDDLSIKKSPDRATVITAQRFKVISNQKWINCEHLMTTPTAFTAKMKGLFDTRGIKVGIACGNTHSQKPLWVKIKDVFGDFCEEHVIHLNKIFSNFFCISFIIIISLFFSFADLAGKWKARGSKLFLFKLALSMQLDLKKSSSCFLFIMELRKSLSAIRFLMDR